MLDFLFVMLQIFGAIIAGAFLGSIWIMLILVTWFEIGHIRRHIRYNHMDNQFHKNSKENQDDVS